MTAPALKISLEQALREHDRVEHVPGVLPVQEFLESLLALILPSLATPSPAQSQRLEAAYLAGAKCIDDAGLLLAVPRDVLLVLMAAYPVPSPTKDTFDSVAKAMMGIVREYPTGSERPSYITNFILAVGGPTMLAAMGHQAIRDATDAELWRFMLATISEDSPEYQIMESLSQSFELDTANPEQARAAFEAHVVAGLAEFKRQAPEGAEAKS